MSIRNEYLKVFSTEVFQRKVKSYIKLKDHFKRF